MSLSLLSGTSRVETPFIIVTIAGYTFGNYSRESRNIISDGSYQKIISKFPNYMKSLNIEKLNGTVNTYTLNMTYAIREGDDPNLLEKVFSKARNDRTIKLSYGDLSLPSFIYKEEEAIITDLKTNFNIESSVINYTLQCTSKALSLAAGTFNFRKRLAKPSDVIKEILYNKTYGLLEVFYGMRNKEKVLQHGLIVSDDKPVVIQDRLNSSVFEYLSYLVSCMTCIADKNDSLVRNFRYDLIIRDDLTNTWGGPYFEILKTSSNVKNNSLDTYEIDIGYPGKNMVLNFNLDDNQTYSILYDYSDQISQNKYIYTIDNEGDIISEYSPALAKSKELLKTTAADKTYWSLMTQYPISGSLTIKGLLRPALLMTYVKINVYFYGQKHISSGYYIVTKQTDTIDESGYRTVLKVTRIKGDDQ